MKKTIFFLYLSVITLIILMIFPSPIYAADTIYLTENGWSEPDIGTWNQETKTATLEKDLDNTTITISSSGLTLDGNGKKLNGNNLLENGVAIGMNVKNTTVKNLQISNFQKGVYTYYNSPSNNIIRNNEITGCLWAVYLYYSTDNTIDSNYIYDCDNGIYVHINCDDSMIIKNTIREIDYSGLKISSSRKNTIKNNDFSYCGSGIDIAYNSDENKIYNNNFIENTIQAKVSGSYGNEFNLPEPDGGNYWSDWVDPDSDLDGFVDNPYVFAGGQDNYPYSKMSGWLKSKNNDDISAPSSEIIVTGTEGSNGWYISDLVVTLSASDGPEGSGIAKTEYSFDNISWNTYLNPFTVFTEGINTIYYRSTDNAGNIENTLSANINIDKTPPSITILNPEASKDYLLNQVNLAEWVVEDSISGIVSSSATVACGEPFDTSSTGQKTFNVNASDNAGNFSEINNIYNVVNVSTFSGFLPPLDNTGKSFKCGSAIPVKFKLTDNKGGNIGNSVARLFLARIEDGIPGVMIEATSKGKSDDLNYFRYDAGSDQYIYNLDTKPLEEGIWRLIVYLDDLQSYTVDIELR